MNSTTRRSYDAPQPSEIDDTEDRMGSIEQLDFDDEEPSARIGDLIPEDELAHEISDQRVREAGFTGASTPDHHPTDDDLDPEVLIREDGARSAREEGDGRANDRDFSIVGSDEIGGGNGLDEAELALRDPLDGKPDRR